jgi:ubiquinone/menaquinone biosynthesis C-methylase UbiE
MAFSKENLKTYLENRESNGWIVSKEEGIIGRLQYAIIQSYIEQYLPPKDCLILDIGLEPGFYALRLARKERRFVIADISEKQLDITRDKIKELKLEKQIEQFVVLDDITDLSIFSNDSFDMVLCMGGTLSYTCEKRIKFLEELTRAAKGGAPLILTVKSITQFFREIITKTDIAKLEEPIKNSLWEVLDTNYKPYTEENQEPAYYAFHGNELIQLFERVGAEVLDIIGLGCLTNNLYQQVDKISQNEDAWNTLLRIEATLGSNANLWDAGDEILGIARKEVV